MEMILVGVTIVAGLTVIIFLRRGGKIFKDDYAYTVPRTGQRGCNRRSVDETIRDAESGICHDTDIDWRTND